MPNSGPANFKVDPYLVAVFFVGGFLLGMLIGAALR